MNTQPLFIGQKLEVFIEKLSFNGGRGISKDHGIVIFVEDAAPNERVLIELTSVKKKFAEGRVLEIVEPSPFRREPPCRVYYECGGCNLQHITYAAQLAEKSNILKEQLRTLTKSHSFEWLSFLQSEKEFNYRNRVQFQVKNKKVGFFARRSHRIADTPYCWLVEEEINHQLTELRKNPSSLEKSRIEIRSASSTGDNFFSQVNTQQNTKIQSLISEIVAKTRPTEVWDLYGGAGNFSLPLAKTFPDIAFTCVEASPDAINFGRQRSQREQITNLTWHRSSVEDFLRSQSHSPRLILIDPPRAGLTPLARMRLETFLSRSQLVYLSCNPASFARDADDILSSSSLRLKWVRGIDMFPQTDHIEVLSYFE